jgi:hypothetical protein
MKLRLACILGILAVALDGAALAQVQPAAPSVAGIVVSSSGTSFVIRTDAGTEQTFDVDTTSTVPTGLLPGTRVTVTYFDLDTGRRHLTSVTRSDVSTDTPPATATIPATAPVEPPMTQFTPTTVTTPPAPTTPDLAPAVPEPPLPAANVAGTERLPDTASELPLLALAGVMTIAAGLVLRELRRRDA